MKFATVKEVAKLKGVTVGYVRKLTYLPKDHPSHLESYRPDKRTILITDKKILQQFKK